MCCSAATRSQWIELGSNYPLSSRQRGGSQSLVYISWPTNNCLKTIGPCVGQVILLSSLNSTKWVTHVFWISSHNLSHMDTNVNFVPKWFQTQHCCQYCFWQVNIKTDTSTIKRWLVKCNAEFPCKGRKFLSFCGIMLWWYHVPSIFFELAKYSMIRNSSLGFFLLLTCSSSSNKTDEFTWRYILSGLNATTLMQNLISRGRNKMTFYILTWFAAC